MSAKLSSEINENESHDTQVYKIEQSLMSRCIHKKAMKQHTLSDGDELLIILGFLWSDNFDPNSSIKANIGSIWIKTITFLSDNDKKNYCTNTYTISIGHKGSNHDRIEELIVRDLKQLSDTNNK